MKKSSEKLAALIPATSNANTPLRQVLNLLEGVRQGSQGYVALCPSHNDNHASLSVAEGDDGRVLVHCFAGCDVADVVGAIGLEVCDLFPRARAKSRQKE